MVQKLCILGYNPVDRKKQQMDEVPEAYQYGWQPFLGLTMYLDSRPLIPRPETEWWTEKLLAHVGTSDVQGTSDVLQSAAGSIFSATDCPKAKLEPEGVEKTTPLRFLDLCAGSGAIGCAALKMLPNAKVYFGEIDPAHEATILKNIRENNLDEKRADIRIGNLFTPFTGEQFDIIAANPPYIPEDRVLDPSVADYEPTLALRAGADGLALIRRIASALPAHLAPVGEAWIECDSAHAEAARELFVAQGLAAEVMRDQYDAPRVIVVHHAPGEVSFPHA